MLPATLAKVHYDNKHIAPSNFIKMAVGPGFIEPSWPYTTHESRGSPWIMDHIRRVATDARLRHVPSAAIQLGRAVELNEWTDARDLPAQRNTEGGKFKLQMPELPRAGDQRIELRPDTMMVERQFAHWSTTPSQPDSYSLLNTAFNDLLNALGIYSSDCNKLLTEDQGGASVPRTREEPSQPTCST